MEGHEVFFRRFVLTVWVDGGYSMYENNNSVQILNESGII